MKKSSESKTGKKAKIEDKLEYLSNNMISKLGEDEQTGSAEYFLAEAIIHKIKALKASDNIIMPKTKILRDALDKMLDLKDRCNIPLIDIVNYNLLNVKPKKTFDMVYLFDLMKSHSYAKLQHFFKQNPLLKFIVNDEKRTLLHLAVQKCSPIMVKFILKHKFDVNAFDIVNFLILIFNRKIGLLYSMRLKDKIEKL